MLDEHDPPHDDDRGERDVEKAHAEHGLVGYGDTIDFGHAMHPPNSGSLSSSKLLDGCVEHQCHAVRQHK